MGSRHWRRCRCPRRRRSRRHCGTAGRGGRRPPWRPLRSVPGSGRCRRTATTGWPRRAGRTGATATAPPPPWRRITSRTGAPPTASRSAGSATASSRRVSRAAAAAAASTTSPRRCAGARWRPAAARPGLGWKQRGTHGQRRHPPPPGPQLDRVALSWRLEDRRVELGRSKQESMRGKWGRTEEQSSGTGCGGGTHQPTAAGVPSPATARLFSLGAVA
uniref:Uncharacterized protein n=1 Tax=Zea mays TaxID=4577 RepID=B6U8H0_MAIZE|nr:hypothetical protein [Zea mays]